MEKIKTVKIGDWIKANIIGLGFYEVVSVNDFHVSVKCLRIFDGKNPDYKGHITCCHRGTDKATGEKIKIDKNMWLNRIVKRTNNLTLT